MTNQEIKKELEKTKIPFASLTVLGNGSTIFVKVKGELSAKRWCALFALMYRGKSPKITMQETSWEKENNKGGFGSSLIRGFLVSVKI